MRGLPIVISRIKEEALMRQALLVTGSSLKCSDYSSIFSSSSHWHITCVATMMEALELTYSKNPDTIFMDLEAPIRGLKKFVTTLAEKFPAINRVLLRSSVFSLSHRPLFDKAHSSFLPPQSGKEVRSFLSRVERFFPFTKKDESTSFDLSPEYNPEAVIKDVYSETVSELGSIERVYALIEQDRELLIKVLTRVNSAHYGLENKVTIPAKAVSLLGLEGVKEMLEETYPSLVLTPSDVA